MNIWMVLALVGVIVLAVAGLLLAWGSVKRYRAVIRAEKASGETVKIPASPIQRRAMLSLVVGISALIAVILLLIENGVVAVFAVDSLRHTFTVILLSAILINGALILPLQHRKTNLQLLDERDRQILRGAPSFQASALILMSALWGIALTETFWAERAIPVDYAYLMFWINAMVYFIAWPMGVFFGYWRMNTYGD